MTINGKNVIDSWIYKSLINDNWTIRLGIVERLDKRQLNYSTWYSRTAWYSSTLHLMRRGWDLSWRYLDICSFRFDPAAKGVKIANFAVWCPYNELRELYKNFGYSHCSKGTILLKFDSQSFSFAFQRLSCPYDSSFAILYPNISPESGSNRGD